MNPFRPRTPPIHIVPGGYQPWHKRRPPKRASWRPLILGLVLIMGCCTLTLGAANILLVTPEKSTPWPTANMVDYLPPDWTPGALLQGLTLTEVQDGTHPGNS